MGIENPRGLMGGHVEAMPWLLHFLQFDQSIYMSIVATQVIFSDKFICLHVQLFLSTSLVDVSWSPYCQCLSPSMSK